MSEEFKDYACKELIEAGKLMVDSKFSKAFYRLQKIQDKLDQLRDEEWEEDQREDEQKYLQLLHGLVNGFEDKPGQ